ncbi:hypothetical protein NLM24_14575 [Nocardia zapadnayensis]|nr:hypothetical protein [Nocardia zapadnayensis]MCX0271906.1 hypothetical protein [Nocardia zapadnayensis]
MVSDTGEYEKVMPLVADHLAKIERAESRTRSTHAGELLAVVRRALVEALDQEGSGHVVPQAIDELARRIAEDPVGTRD